ncbi:hypothetical protein B0H14DRAFT_2590792 [Mycena olivaceomarginata]|nr:hypothetical protein B0H14DRAFT_2590792 [Mycena olivaceomarginata]
MMITTTGSCESLRHVTELSQRHLGGAMADLVEHDTVHPARNGLGTEREAGRKTHSVRIIPAQLVIEPDFPDINLFPPPDMGSQFEFKNRHGCGLIPAVLPGRYAQDSPVFTCVGSVLSGTFGFYGTIRIGVEAAFGSSSEFSSTMHSKWVPVGFLRGLRGKIWVECDNTNICFIPFTMHVLKTAYVTDTVRDVATVDLSSPFGSELTEKC